MMRCLLLTTLLFAYSAWGSNTTRHDSSAIAKLQRDAFFEAPLSKLLHVPLSGNEALDLDARLQRAFIQCRELGVTSIMYEAASDTSMDDVVYCSRLRYLRHQRQHVRNMRATLASHQVVADVERQVETRTTDDLTFQEFFELYTEKEKPVLLQLKDNGKDSVVKLLGLETLSNSDIAAENVTHDAPDKLERFLDVCFSQKTETQGSFELRLLQIEDEACSTMLKHFFRVPIYITHDYVQRTNASHDKLFLPAVFILPPATDVGLSASQSFKDIVACPYGLHMLAIPLEDGAHAQVTLIDRKFEPINLPILLEETQKEVEVTLDANVAISADGGKLLDNDYFQHVPELYSAIELRVGNLLFIPGSIITKMHSLTSSARTTKLLRFCYCDAANVKEVKEAAGLDVLLLANDTKDNGVYTLLRPLQTPGFDSSFSRRPTLTDTSWSTYIKWPRDPAFLTKRNRRYQPNDDDDDKIEEQLSRRERLKQWQDDKRWESYIASLTLPVAWPPLVVNTTRTTATLRWQELYQPMKNDRTEYGYEVSWIRENQAGMTTENLQVTHEAINVTQKQFRRSKLPSTFFGDDFDGHDLEAVITGLQAETAYSFSVRLVVGEDRGAASGISRRVVTSPCTPPSHIRGVPEVVDMEETCVTLRWLDVEDDGGKKIELYLVSTERLPEKGEQGNRGTHAGADNRALVGEYEKIIAVNASSEVNREQLTSGAMWLSTKICGLFSNTAYIFRVAAMNVLGAGHWSRRSNHVELYHHLKRLLMPKKSESYSQAIAIPMLKGVGDPGYTAVSGVRILSQSDLSTLVAQDPHSIYRASGTQDEDATLTHVVLSDVREQVQLMSHNDGAFTVERTFEAWTGHYSPRLYDVSAELILADPPDASQPLRNSIAVRDRIVLAIRELCTRSRQNAR
ncbi:Immunoglobulin-like fold [Plasmopara halstedii]|uniref:Immunoglobulin-like fold n=1 Tax=Plasmopara halstedii TaxID=4781 RepID=A0A0N7L4V8_PLAHL|nr:Immunoglobulin-like fold [Plasmopara halstedii]CEG39755.1 Immunoglobulin-like fold [Plasmopara halstedii]|eukprot:XP_024576124.1 Immunoglobulin-like fold [Plasmopara halstedii]